MAVHVNVGLVNLARVFESDVLGGGGGGGVGDGCVCDLMARMKLAAPVSAKGGHTCGVAMATLFRLVGLCYFGVFLILITLKQKHVYRASPFGPTRTVWFVAT